MKKNQPKEISQAEIKKARKRDSIKVPLRINPTTVILVDPENCNEEYRLKYLDRIRKCQDM